MYVFSDFKNFLFREVNKLFMLKGCYYETCYLIVNEINY